MLFSSIKADQRYIHKKREKRIETQSEVKTKVRRIEKKNSFDEEEQKNKTKPIKVMLLPVH